MCLLVDEILQCYDIEIKSSLRICGEKVDKLTNPITNKCLGCKERSPCYYHYLVKIFYHNNFSTWYENMITLMYDQKDHIP